MRLSSFVAPLLVLAGIAGPAGAADHAVTVGPGNTFSPATLNISAGDRVIWSRVGGIHNVRADDGSFSNGDPNGSWTTYDRVFNAVGSFEYYCEAHSTPSGTTGVDMNGVVHVCLLYTSPSPRDGLLSRMPSSA